MLTTRPHTLCWQMPLILFYADETTSDLGTNVEIMRLQSHIILFFPEKCTTWCVHWKQKSLILFKFCDCIASIISFVVFLTSKPYLVHIMRKHFQIILIPKAFLYSTTSCTKFTTLREQEFSQIRNIIEKHTWLLLSIWQLSISVTLESAPC